jgi:hypothetical protein
MTDHIHPQDKLDALSWLIQQVRQHSPEYSRDQLNRNRMHIAEQLRDQAQRHARR